MNKIITSLLLFMPMMAFAQTADDPFGSNVLANEGTALGTKSLPDTIASILNIILGFLGILSTAIILLGGFKWMTSQGNEENVKKARELIGAGIVGLVIILSAYAISRFVLKSLYNETIAV